MVARLSDVAWQHFIEVIENVAKLGGWCVFAEEDRVEWSERTYAIHELDSSDPISMQRAVEFYLPEYVDMVQKVVSSAATDGKPFEFRAQIRTAKGKVIWVESHGTPINDENGKTRLLVGTFEDITDQVRTLRESVSQRDFLRKIVDNILEGLIVIDEAGRIQSFNRAAESMFGYASEEMVGRNVCELMPPLDRERHNNYLENYQSGGDPQIIGVGREVQGQRKDGSLFPLFLSVAEVDLHDRVHYLGTVRDLSAEKAAQEQIERLSNYDDVTGLPSRKYLLNYLEKYPAGRPLSLAYINIDFFKRIHLAYGMAISDRVLRAVAERLSAVSPKQALVCRDVADRFWMALPGQESCNHGYLSALFDAVGLAIEQPIRIDGFDHHISVSIGATISDGQAAAEDLLSKAEVALHDSMKRGRGLFVIQDNGEPQAGILERYQIERELRAAIDNDELQFYLQPKYDQTMNLISGELLVRWFRNDGSQISPELFIPIAEDVGLIHRLGQRALEHAARMLRELQERGQSVSLAVNVSPVQFLKDGFIEAVERIFRTSRADASRLTVEVTESLLSAGLEDIHGTAQELTRMGISISIDDFGTGYSNLQRIQSLPISELKVDRSFVFNCLTPNGGKLVDAMIRIADSMGLSVVCEGVESEQVLSRLQNLKVDVFQGFYLGSPMPFRDFLSLPARLPSATASP